MHPVYTPKVCITVVSHFSRVLQSSQEKSKTIVMQHLGGGGGGGRGGKQGCIVVYVKMVNSLGHVRESNPGPLAP